MSMLYRYCIPFDRTRRAGLIIGALCALLFTSLATTAQTQWEVVPATGMKGGTTVYFVDGETGFALGGTSSTTWVLKTTDGGRKWTSQQWGQALLFGLTNSDDSTIYITGHWPQCTCAVIMRSPNKGKGWYLDTIDNSFGFYDISFPTPQIGYTGGYLGVIMKTTDNGESWTQLPTPNGTDVFTDLVFTSAETGYALAGPNGEFYNSSILYKTTDGGASWGRIADYSEAANFFDMLWLNEQTGVLIGGANSTPLVLRTVNGGVDWEEVPISTNGRYPFALSFADEQIGYAVGAEGLILRTTDGGASWTEEDSPTGSNIFDVHATGDRVFALAEGNVVIERVDASGVWEAEESGGQKGVEVELLPAPFTDAAQIVLRNAPSNRSYSFMLYDGLGREVVRIEEVSSEASVTLERGDLSSGFYLYRVLSSEGDVAAEGGIIVR